MRQLYLSLVILMLCLAPAFATEAPKEDAKPAATEPAPATPAPAATETKPAETAAAPAENPGRYAPDFCDYEITFPEKPYKAQKCLPSGTNCYELDSYTMVYDLKTTVDVSVTCSPSTPAAFTRYNKAVMKAALQGMAEQRNLENTTINFAEDKDTHTGSLTGTGVTGTQPKIYTAQLWIGQNSIFTIQAELIGSSHEVADKTFSEILKSIKFKGGKQVAMPKGKKSQTPAAKYKPN